MDGELRKRRTVLQFMGAVGAGLALPRFVLAQAAKKIPTVAVLYAGESADDETVVRPFFEKMEKLGWMEGKSVAYDRHSGKGTRQYLATMVSVAADREPDLVYATTASLAAATVKENKNLPVVFTTNSDPVAAGLVESLAKPGKNATGTYQVTADASQKRFELVRQAFPQVKRMGAIFDRSAQDYQTRRAAHEKSARAHGIELVSAEFTNFEAIARILAQFRRDNLLAVEITPSFALIARRVEVAKLASINGVALIAHRMEWAEAGAVLTYGADSGEAHRRAARIASRILKGAKPGEIPVERVQKNELALNTRVAEELALHIPKTVQQRADKVFS
jgi:putative ABC transport system substrate-binding protein